MPKVIKIGYSILQLFKKTSHMFQFTGFRLGLHCPKLLSDKTECPASHLTKTVSETRFHVIIVQYCIRSFMNCEMLILYYDQSCHITVVSIERPQNLDLSVAHTVSTRFFSNI